METTTIKFDPSARSLPSEAVQADRLTWLSQLRNGGPGDPTLLLSGLRQGDTNRWDIGIVNAWVDPSDGTKVVLEFPKPANYREGEKPTTAYVFEQEAAWLLQAHVLYGGTLAIMPSKHNRYYYPAVQTPLNGRKRVVNADRLIAGCGPQQDARLANPRAYHDHTRGNLKPTHQRKIAQQVGQENERARRPKVTRADVITASLNLWRPSLLFPALTDYVEAFRQVYAVLDRHPLGGQPVADT